MRALVTVLAGVLGLGVAAAGQTCTTQSAMQPAERDGLANAAAGIARMVAAGDAGGLRAVTIADLQKDFAGVEGLVAATAPRLKGSTVAVEQVYVLDASRLAAGAEAQFECVLNQSANAADFSIPQLPAGRYGFAMVRMEQAAPWQVSMLLRQENGAWKLAGLYPKALTAGGHDGLWYWREARAEAGRKQNWSAWLSFQEARGLLQPAGFVTSTHLDKLDAELTAAAPPAVAGGVTAEAPLVLTAGDGAEYRFTSVGVSDALGEPDVAVHLAVTALGDGSAARARNVAAAKALVAAHPELRQAFHGVIVVAEAAGTSPYTTVATMDEIK